MNLTQVRYLCDQSFYHFVKIIGGSVNQGRDIIKEIHGVFCKEWQNPANKRIGAGMARGWRKTVVLTGWDIIWTWLQNPEERQLIACEKERLGTDILKWIKNQLLQNKFLRKIYADKVGMIDTDWTKKNPWKATAIELPKEGLYTSPSVQVLGIRGAAQGGHFTTIHLDDIIGQAAIESIDIMDDARSWVDNLIELLVEPDFKKLDASRVKITGSPWGSGDIYDYIRMKYPEYKWLIAPCRKDSKLKDEENLKWIQNPGAEEDGSNFPVFTTSYYIKKLLEDPHIYWSQHACQPQKAGELHKFDISWLHYYRVEDRDGHIFLICDKCDIDVPLAKIPLYGMIDVAGFGEIKSSRGARNALLIGGQPREMIQKFIIYAWAKRLKKPSVLRQEIYDTHNKYKPRLWRIDTTGVGSSIYADIQEEKRKKCPHLRVTPLPSDVTKGVKDDDIQGLINPVANGEIHVHQTMKDLLTEMQQYPHSSTKDLLDMLAKLNRYYWSRKPKIDSKLSRTLDYMTGRSSVGGY